MEAEGSSVLAQRAASEGPRWTRAVEAQSAPIPEERVGKIRRMRREWPGALLARRTRTMKGMEGHPHWSCAPGTRALRRASFNGRTSTNMGALSRERNKRAWKEHLYRSMRAVKGSLGHSLH